MRREVRIMVSMRDRGNHPSDDEILPIPIDNKRLWDKREEVWICFDNRSNPFFLSLLEEHTIVTTHALTVRQITPFQ
jgi:hypothetical protein